MHQLEKTQTYLVFVVLIVGGWFGMEAAPAADPRIATIAPYGLQRGQEVTVTFAGARLKDAQALLLYRPGITVKQLKAVAANKVEATLAVAPQCPLGLHALRLRAATGISNLRTISVGALPVVAEKEPNSDFARPQEIAFNTTVSGVVQNEDVDYFAVDVKKGDRISVELEGIRLGNPTFFDPFVAVLNTERFELARCDDIPLLRQDALCGLVAPRDGRYIVEVRESAYGGNGNCRYLVHIGAFPRPTAVLPAGGPPGAMLAVKWIGDAAGDWTSTITLPTDARDQHDLFARDAFGVAPSPNRVRVSALANVMESEPNDDRRQATTVAVPAAVNGVIERPGDSDWFKFHAKKGDVLDVRVFARHVLRSPLDSVLTITRAKGAAVGANDDSGGPDSYLRFKAPADDDYYVTLRDQLSGGGADYVYRIEMAPPAPALTITLPERIQYVPMTVSVPRGGRFAVMVNAARANFGGELRIAAEGLPRGVTASPVTMAASMSSVPMIFTAAADAPLDGALVDLVGRSTNPKQPVVGHLRQRTLLVRGQNNRDVWGHDADRMAVAATESAPFSIQVVQPKVPVVRHGAMQLKVVAARTAGFKTPISIFLGYNPPGIGSSRSIVIGADKTEAAIPLTANANARFGTYPIVVIGRGNVSGGNLELASQLAQLEIADTFVNLTFEKTAVELGQQAEVVVRVETKHEFAGNATLQLLGLPARTHVDPKPIPFTKETTEVVFPIRVDAAARPGKYQTLVCRAIVTQDGEQIVQTLGSGELRIDKPLPPKVAAKPAQPAKPVAKKTPVKKPVKRRLSRLEQLRLLRQQNKGG